MCIRDRFPPCPTRTRTTPSCLVILTIHQYLIFLFYQLPIGIWDGEIKFCISLILNNYTTQIIRKFGDKRLNSRLSWHEWPESTKKLFNSTYYRFKKHTHTHTIVLYQFQTTNLWIIYFTYYLIFNFLLSHSTCKRK